MADKGPGSTGRSQSKRLAKAKIKPNDNGIKSTKGRNIEEEKKASEAEKKKARKQKLTAIGVGIFAVIMALSMMLPSLSYIFGNGEEQQAATEQEEAEKAEKEASDEKKESEDDAEEVTESTDMDSVDANYHKTIDPLEAKLEESPDDLATLLNLGNDYMSWASAASSYATDEEGSSHVTELYQKAMDYFDRYLELNDSNAVRINRAMCQLYTGDIESATKALKKLTKDAPDFAPAWQYLGMVYEYFEGDQDAAKEAYQKAIEADADDEYGCKSYANQRLAAMAAQQNGGELTEDATETTETTSTEGAAALEEALKAGK